MTRLVHISENRNKEKYSSFRSKRQFESEHDASSLNSSMESESTASSSGTFTAARTTSRFSADQNKLRSNLSYKDAVEQKQDKVSTCNFYGSQKSFETDVFVTQKPKNKRVYANKSKSAKQGLIDKINMKSKMNPPGLLGYFDDELEFHTGNTPPPRLLHNESSSESSTYHNSKNNIEKRDLNLSNSVVLNQSSDDVASHVPDSSKDTSSPSSTFNITAAPSLDKALQLKSHEIGFKNHGNTCYINSTMQCILGLDIVVTEVVNSKELLSNPVNDDGLLQAFSKLCIAYGERDRDWADKEIKKVKSIMETLDNMFVGNKMQDASEFLGRFLDEIKEDVKKRSQTDKVVEFESSCPRMSGLVYNNFVHEKEEIMICCSCRTETKSRTSDMSTWCDITTSSNRTRSAALQQLLEESLAMETRIRRCEVCEGDQATVTSKLVTLPKVFIIFLKRFRYSTQGDSSSGKDSRRVSIPDTLSVSNLVSEGVFLPDTALPVRLCQDQTPGRCPPRTPDTATPLSCPETPPKFKDLTQEQLNMLGEEDQLEYMVHLSEKEASKFNSTVLDMVDEDEDMKIALEASMRESGSELSQQVIQMESCRTPSRKRGYGELTPEEDFVGVAGDNNSHSSSRHGQGRHEKLPSYANAVKGDSPSNADTKIKGPASKEQEEADLKRALELSSLEASFLDIHDENLDDVENNNNMMDVVTSGLPEHSYQLQSVVSHYGSSASAGHYVADVYRPDGGGWFRYDDARVSKTDGLTVRTGSNCCNGYILTYMYQPLWKKCKTRVE